MKTFLRFTIVALMAASISSCCIYRGQNEENRICKSYSSISAGATAAKVSQSSDFGDDNSESKLGPKFGVNALMPINPNLRLETGLGFAGKGSKSSYSSQDGEESFSQEDKLNLSYLEVPVLLRYQFNNTGFNVYGGLQPAFLLSAKQKIEYTGSPSQDIDVKDRFKGFDTSAIFGVGYEFNNGLMLNAGYDLGLMNIAATSYSGYSTKNQVFIVYLAYNFRKNKIPKHKQKKSKRYL